MLQQLAQYWWKTRGDSHYADGAPPDCVAERQESAATWRRHSFKMSNTSKGSPVLLYMT